LRRCKSVLARQILSKIRSKLALAVLASCFLASTAARAAVTFYGSQAAFDAAFPGDTHIGFTSLAPATGDSVVLPGATTTIGGDTFSSNSTLLALADSDPGPGPYGDYKTTFISSQSIGAANNVLTITTPGVTALGFDYGSYVTFPLTLTLTLNTGQTFSPADAFDSPQFIGFSSGGATITSITLSGVFAQGQLGGTVIDLIDVSQAGSAPPPPPPMPEPADWALMLLGFGVTGASLRRRRAALYT
jgi:hypothetical protein